MEELLLCTQKLDQAIDKVVPLLIVDEWSQANALMPQVLNLLQDFMTLLMQNHWDNEASKIVMILKQILHSMEQRDTIRLADLLAYDMGAVLQMVYQRKSGEE